MDNKRIALINAKELDASEFDALESHLRQRRDFAVEGALDAAADRQKIPTGDAA